MQEILIATGNRGKYKEIMEILGEMPFEFLFLGDMGVDAGDFVEDGATFRENAMKKAKYFFDKTGVMALAEDSGLLVDALPGELGVKTRRWGAGEEASDEEWIAHFMERMGGERERGARFVCSACVFGGDIEEYFEGETRGEITAELEAAILPGLPLSSCFRPEGQPQVYAALGASAKNEVSHRGKAMEKVKVFLEGEI